MRSFTDAEKWELTKYAEDHCKHTGEHINWDADSIKIDASEKSEECVQVRVEMRYTLRPEDIASALGEEIPE